MIWNDPQFGNRLITLMAALALVLQILMVAQRGLVSNIRAFGVQSGLLAMMAATIALFNDAPRIFLVAALMLILKAILLPVALERLVVRLGIRLEIEPFLNVPLSVIVSGLLTLLAYMVAESFHRPEEAAGAAHLGHNTLAAAIAMFLIGFFMMANRRKALTQVLGLLSLENGVFLAAISLTYGMPLVIEAGIFFDVLVAALLLAILIYRIRETFDSTDVSRLSRLRG
ncbi:MAG TPA: NADH-quinone oxidoreductase subunit K [Bryobacteraceae bacterium]|nr:NADH-quinone oxidoreductase subunit K [Bryobacteraceae bacterium]